MSNVHPETSLDIFCAHLRRFLPQRRRSSRVYVPHICRPPLVTQNATRDTFTILYISQHASQANQPASQPASRARPVSIPSHTIHSPKNSHTFIHVTSVRLATRCTMQYGIQTIKQHICDTYICIYLYTIHDSNELPNRACN